MHIARRTARLGLLAIVGALASGCGINTIPTYDEAVKAAWGQVQNQYQRRADLVPNLVATVKGYAAHERETLQAVIEARSKVSQMNVSPEILSDPAAFKTFEQNQAQLTSALSRLMVVVERYPDLKANQNFLQLQSQLEGTENRISVARRDYIAAVQRTTPRSARSRAASGTAMMYSDMQMRETFAANEGAVESADRQILMRSRSRCCWRSARCDGALAAQSTFRR